MATIIKYVCDICGKEVGEGELASVPILCHLENEEDPSMIDCIQRDMCPDCLKKYTEVTWHKIGEFTKDDSGNIRKHETHTKDEDLEETVPEKIKLYLRDKFKEYFEKGHCDEEFNNRYQSKYISKKITSDRKDVFINSVYALYHYLADNIEEGI